MDDVAERSEDRGHARGDPVPTVRLAPPRRACLP